MRSSRTLIRVLTVVAVVAALLIPPVPPAPPAQPTVAVDGVAYPNPLYARDRTMVTTVARWEGSRRGELLADFERHVYGAALPRPVRQSFAVATTEFPGVRRTVVTASITGPNGTGTFPFRLFVPTDRTRPLGTFLVIDHRGSATDDPTQDSDYLPVRRVTAAGYAIAVLDANEVAPDDPATYRTKMIDLFHPAGQPLPDDAGRAVSAWAWAASRVMDHLVTHPDLDPARVAVLGHSRSGKAALLAGAADTRFAAVVADDSGSTGDRLARRGDAGIGAETVARINRAFPHWFAQAYRAYDDREEDLPVDQHGLLALVAPRRLVISGATDDANADPEGGFLAYTAAAQVYRLYGLGGTGLPSTAWPPPTGTAFRGDAMSYHLQSGRHALSAADWAAYLNGDLFSRTPPRP